MKGRVSVALLLGGLWGCGLVLPVDALRPSEEAGVLPEASPEDSPSEEGPSEADGRPDGTIADASDAAIRFCLDAAHVEFLCADFEQPSLVPPFSAVTVNDGGTVNRVEGGFASSFSLELAYLQDAASATLRLDGVPPVTEDGGVLEIRMRVRVEQLGGPVALDILRVDGERELSLDLAVNGAIRFDPRAPDGASSITTTGRSVLPGQWHDLRFVLTPMGASTQLSLELDGVPGMPLTIPYRVGHGVPSTLRIGDPSMARLDMPWRLRVDDVTVGR
jgi:hypothetical protein